MTPDTAEIIRLHQTFDRATRAAMALRIEGWLGRDHGGAAEVRLAQQAASDLWQARVAVTAKPSLQRRKAIHTWRGQLDHARHE
jgi:plasmid maintenance system antidote protein VapI